MLEIVEVVEEFNGEGEMLKKRVVKKETAKGVIEMSDEELEREKQRLLKLIADKRDA